MMQSCRLPHCGGQILNDAGRLACTLCGRAVFEPEPDTLTKLLSNSTPEDAPERSGRLDRVTMSDPDLTAIKERVMARIREEVKSSTTPG